MEIRDARLAVAPEEVGLHVVRYERYRQIQGGHTLELDMEQSVQTLVRAALCYITNNDTDWPHSEPFDPNDNAFKGIVQGTAMLCAALDVMYQQYSEQEEGMDRG